VDSLIKCSDGIYIDIIPKSSQRYVKMGKNCKYDVITSLNIFKISPYKSLVKNSIPENFFKEGEVSILTHKIIIYDIR
jgi:hypothetical protein